MEIRIAKEQDYAQLAEMKWLHCEEDDVDYGENNLINANKDKFITEFIEFLFEHKDYKIFVACDESIITSAMFIYLIPKTPKPNRDSRYIAYLTNVYTNKHFRNKSVGTQLLNYVKMYLSQNGCELMFAWPSENSVNWYLKNGFSSDNEIFECKL